MQRGLGAWALGFFTRLKHSLDHLQAGVEGSSGGPGTRRRPRRTKWLRPLRFDRRNNVEPKPVTIHRVVAGGRRESAQKRQKITRLVEDMSLEVNKKVKSTDQSNAVILTSFRLQGTVPNLVQPQRSLLLEDNQIHIQHEKYSLQKALMNKTNLGCSSNAVADGFDYKCKIRFASSELTLCDWNYIIPVITLVLHMQWYLY